MSKPETDTVRLLLDQFAAALGRTLEAVTGTKVQTEVAPNQEAAAVAPGLIWLEHRIEPDRDAVLWIGIPEESGPAMEDALNQAVADLASGLAARCGLELHPQPGVRSAVPSDVLARGTVRVVFDAADPVNLPLSVSAALMDLLAETPAMRPAAETGPSSATLDLLLDLELPVSVSFGNSQVTLQDALRFSAGSLIELDRTVEDPVEIIVNDFVIARGEVVVVNGNYGVRIQQIASRHDRLQSTGNLLAAGGLPGTQVRNGGQL